MKIAALIPGLPEPADRGTYKRYAAMVAMLTRLGEVDLCTLVDQPLEPGAEESMRRRVARLHAPRVAFQPWKGLASQLFDPLPPTVRHWQDPAILPGIRDFFAGNTYDLVFLGDLVAIPYAQATGLDRFPCWIDRSRVDLEYQRQLAAVLGLRGVAGWKDRLRRSLVARYERFAARDFATGQVVCAPSDRAALQAQVSADAEIRVLANGIERDEFPDQGPLNDEPTLMIAGAMDYRPNTDGALWYLREVWPAVRRGCPGASLAIVGRNPIPELLAFDGKDGVQVTSAVPSMLPWYRQSRVVCAPIRIGGGTRLKVVECWSVGRPLVATSVAVDGLEAAHGRNCLVADDPARLAEETLRALEPAVAQALRAGSLATAPHYGWERVTAPLEKEWRGAYARGASRAVASASTSS